MVAYFQNRFVLFPALLYSSLEYFIIILIRLTFHLNTMPVSNENIISSCDRAFCSYGYHIHIEAIFPRYPYVRPYVCICQD